MAQASWRSGALAAAAGIAFLVAGGMSAAAQTDAEKAVKWGLIGTWSPDCTLPASHSNDYLTYIVSGANVVHKRDFGDLHDTNDVKHISLLSDGLEIEIYLASLTPPQTRFYEYVKAHDQIRTKYNHDTNGQYSIKDFIFTVSGQPAKWLSKCR